MDCSLLGECSVRASHQKSYLKLLIFTNLNSSVLVEGKEVAGNRVDADVQIGLDGLAVVLLDLGEQLQDLTGQVGIVDGDGEVLLSKSENQ